MTVSVTSPRQALFALLFAAVFAVLPVAGVFAANHREAPLTALDHTADITDWYAFVSYDDATKVTMILNTDPLLEAANGPNYHPFDPEVVYDMKVDNNHDGDEDLQVVFRFQSEIRAPDVFTGFVGAGAGIPAAGNSPAPVDDPFYIDLGAAFDTLNFRASAFATGVAAVLTDVQDSVDNQNFAADAVAGYNVNSIAIELLIGTGDQDRFSMSEPKNDRQFAGYLLDPLLARVINAAYGGAAAIPPPPRSPTSRRC